MSVREPTLLEVATYARKRSQFWARAVDVLVFTTVLLPLSAVAMEAERGFQLSALVITAAVFIIYIVDWRSRHFHYVSRHAQRLALLEDGFDTIIDAFQTVELRKVTNDWESGPSATAHYQPYYTGTKKPGHERLRDNLQQSVFWTRELLDYHRTDIRWFPVYAALLACIAAVPLVAFGPPDSRYDILILFLATLSYVTIHYLKRIYECSVAIRGMFDIDRRLDSVQGYREQHLLAIFAEYAVLVARAPVIPQRSHLRNRARLRKLWDDRLRGNAAGPRSHMLPVAVDNTRISIESNIVPDWIGDGRFRKLLLSVAQELARRVPTQRTIDRISVTKVTSFGAVPVFEVIVYSADEIFRHLVLRLHQESTAAIQELNVLKMIAGESQELLAYVPFEEPFISEGALFYYHVNIQTHDQLQHIDDFVARYLIERRDDFDSYFFKLLHGLNVVFSTYGKLSQSPDVLSGKQFREHFRTLVNDAALPPFVIDTRNKLVSIAEGHLKIFDDAEPLERGARVTHTLDRDDDSLVCVSVTQDSYSSIQSDCHEVRFRYAGGVVSIIFDQAAYEKCFALRGTEISSLMFVPKKVIKTLSEHLLGTEDKHLDLSFGPDGLEQILSYCDRRVLTIGFRHTDLHCANCLVSTSNFKLIDVAGSKRSLFVFDLARLEISLLARLGDRMNLTENEFEECLAAIEAGDFNNSSRARILGQLISLIRQTFYKANPLDADTLSTLLCYRLELGIQLRYSLYSPVRIRPPMRAVLRYWSEHLGRLISTGTGEA